MTSIDTSEDIVVDRPIPRETIRGVDQGVLVTCNDHHCHWQGLFPRATLAKEAVEAHYDHEGRGGEYHYGRRSYTIVRLLDETTAQTVDESSLGLSVEENRIRAGDGSVREVEFPRTTESVDDLVQRGDLIRLPADREKKVASVSTSRSHGLPVWSVRYVDVDVDLTKAGRHDYYFANELIAQDGSIYTSYGPDPLTAPTFKVIGGADHQTGLDRFGGAPA